MIRVFWGLCVPCEGAYVGGGGFGVRLNGVAYRKVREKNDNDYRIKVLSLLENIESDLKSRK